MSCWCCQGFRVVNPGSRRLVLMVLLSESGFGFCCRSLFLLVYYFLPPSVWRAGPCLCTPYSSELPGFIKSLKLFTCVRLRYCWSTFTALEMYSLLSTDVSTSSWCLPTLVSLPTLFWFRLIYWATCLLILAKVMPDSSFHVDCVECVMLTLVKYL